MGRRGENIRKRKDGRWEARVVQGRPLRGRTNYKYFYGRSYQEVKRKKKAFLEECSALSPNEELPLSPDNAARKLLFREVAARWLATKKTVVKESTFVCYTIMLEKHILPALGERPASEITSSLLSAFLKKQKSNGRLRGGALSNKTLSDMKAILMQILRFAKGQSAISAVPECPTVTSRQRDISVFTLQEQKRLEQKALKEDTPFSLRLLLSLYGGLRIGEVCGLQWQDFNCENGTVTINKTVSRITNVDKQTGAKTKVVIGSPKTDCSHRTIPLPTPVFQYFMQRRRDGDCYVVSGTRKCMEPRVCLCHYKRLLRRAGVSDHTFHAIRHTFATRCVENGVDIKSLSEIMGHSNVKITMQRYVHPSMDSKIAQINKLPCFHASGQISGQSQEEIA